MADVMRTSLHVDPDAQATVTDFIDYTEHLPSDIRRSLALIEKLNDLVSTSHDEIHTLTKQWSNKVVASDGASAEKVASDLRGRISYQKELSRKYAWASLAEARRLDQEVSRHQSLLRITGLKLDALPLPPSRDPTPKPLSPRVARIGDAGGTNKTGGPKIKLRLDKVQAPRQGGRSGHVPRPRHITIVPGEVLPPPNPHSPTDSGFSDWESPSLEPSPAPRRPGPKPQKALKVVRTDDGGDKAARKKKDRAPRDPTRMGTNVHSAVAGISTSNALLMLTPPPEIPIPGSRHAPWTRLTEWEMARLRKRMKKNAVWTPSDTMIRRELTDAGRGPENYQKSKQRHDETGEELIDCDNLASRAPADELKPGEIPLGSKSKLTNKGMSLNVQKKHKKLLLAQEMALELAKEAANDVKQLKQKGSSAAEIDRAKEAARLRAETVESKLSLLGPQFRDLFTRPSGSMSPEKDRIVLKSRGKKRKRDQAHADESQLHSQLHSEIIVTPSPNSSAQHGTKKRKPNATPTGEAESSPMGTTTTIKVPLAAAAPSPAKHSTATTRAGSASANKPEPRRPSLVIKPPAPPSRRSSRHSTPGAERMGSRQSPHVASGERSRRRSGTPGTPAVVTLATSRRKRPAPGLVLSAAGGNAISVGKRDKRPSKKSGSRKTSGGVKEETADEDEVDPNEPRYCMCNDVSWGTMVACENEDCEKQWFHLECVGLTEIPGRRTKWWCPDCSAMTGRRKA